MTQSMLAAVYAAANGTELPAAAGNEPKENESMSTPATPAAPATITSLAALTAAYPALCAELQTASRTEGLAAGAAAERERIAGIDKLARPGREKIIAEAKADPQMTAEKTAVKIVEADDATRDKQLSNIKGVETETGNVGAALTPAGGAGGKDAKESGTTEDEWKAEFTASKALQTEFASVGDYVALKRAEAAGTAGLKPSRAAK
jgi:hypothetical protein